MATADKRNVKLLVFGAALRKGSLNDRLAELAADCITAKGAVADVATMGDFTCPPYDGDEERDEGVPGPAKALSERLLAADGFVIASPEYNASMPGVLKNTIDWTSRLQPQPFNGRQGLLLSASPSMAGGNRGLWALRIPLEHLGARIYPDMFSLAQAHAAFNDKGKIADEMLGKRFETVIACFLDLVEAAKHYPTLKKQWVEFLGERAPATIDRVQENPVAA